MFHNTRHRSLVLALILTAFGCGSVQEGAPQRTGGRSPGTIPRGPGGALAEATALYSRNGLMAVASPVAFVGRVAFFAGQSSDSTLALVTLSLAPRSLSFTREGERYRASYSVRAEIKSAAGVISVIDATQPVRVASYQETQGLQESVIFQRFFYARPGVYQFSLQLRDQAGARTSTYSNDLTIPDVSARGISSVLPVYEGSARASLAARPTLVSSPRATATFGRDSALFAYVEAYGHDPSVPVRYALRSERGALIWSDSLRLEGSREVASSVLRLPVASLGLGVARVQFWVPGSRDTMTAPLFVSFGEDLPAASFADMLNYLRFYVNPEQITALREGSAETQPARWARFLRDTDPTPSTPEHEGLLEYFARIRRANDRYREEAVAGWLTSRGMVFVTLGDPDRVAPLGTVGRVLSEQWQYDRFALTLIFQDRTGLGRWTLTPSSTTEFNVVAARVRDR